MNPTRSRVALPHAVLGLLLAVWIVLGAWICLSAPFGSGTDESIRYVAFAAATNRWATARDAASYNIDHFYYPPLYFLLFAPFSGNDPALTTGFPAVSGNIRMRWSGSARLVATEELAKVPPQLLRLYRAAKFLSLVFGVGVIVCLAAAVRRLFSGEHVPWLVLGTTGPLLLLPQFLYFHTLVNNDCLVNFLCALGLLGFISSVQRTASGDVAGAGRRGVGCAAAVGLGLLTKPSAVALLPLLPALAWLRWRFQERLAPRDRFFDSLRHLCLLTTVSVAAGGWWVLRSSLAGDPAGLQDQRLAHGWAFRSAELSSGQLLSLLNDVARTFIALFAGSYYGIPDRIYTAYLLIAAGVLVALTAALLRRRRESPRSAAPRDPFRFVWTTLVCTVMFNLFLVAVYNAQVLAPQGRLLFPTLIAAGALFAGALQIISAGQRRVLAPLVCVLLLALGGLFLWTFRQRMVPAVLQPAEKLLPLGIVAGGNTSQVGPIWAGTVTQPLLLREGRLTGFRVLVRRTSFLPQFGTVLHARLRRTLAEGAAGHDFQPTSLGENGSADRWTDIELTEPLDLTETTPGLLALEADEPWFRTPGSYFTYEVVTLESSPRLKPMTIDGKPSAFGLAITAVYR